MAGLLVAFAFARRPSWFQGARLARRSRRLLSLSAVDLSRYPQASLVAQVSGILPKDGTSLPVQAFSVKADGIPVAGLDVSPAGGKSVPASTVLLLDESGSMEGDAITEAVAASRGFVQAMRPDDSVAIHSFGDGFRVIHELSADKAALSASLDALSLQHGTLLYDGVSRSLEVLGHEPATRAKYLIILSDGGDTGSTLSLNEIVTQVRSSGAQVYAIGLKTRDFNSEPLQRIAESSGGRYLETPDPEALSSLYVNLARDLQNQFLISLTLAPQAKDKTTGEISVTVSSSDASATATSGFFYPAPVTPQAKAASPAGGAVITGPGWLRTFVDWNGSLYLILLATFALVFLGLFLLSGVIAPKRNVLKEYGDLLENRRNLGPKPAEKWKQRGAHWNDWYRDSCQASWLPGPHPTTYRGRRLAYPHVRVRAGPFVGGGACSGDPCALGSADRGHLHCGARSRDRATRLSGHQGPPTPQHLRGAGPRHPNDHGQFAPCGPGIRARTESGSRGEPGAHLERVQTPTRPAAPGGRA